MTVLGQERWIFGAGSKRFVIERYVWFCSNWRRAGLLIEGFDVKVRCPAMCSQNLEGFNGRFSLFAGYYQVNVFGLVWHIFLAI